MFSNLVKLKTLVAVLALLSAPARSEEQSIMTGCTVSAYNKWVGNTVEPTGSVTCDGGFKTWFQSDFGVNQEITMTLAKPATIVSIFVENEVAEAMSKIRFGTEYIWVGTDNSTPFSTATMTRCSQPFFDTGFFKLTPTTGSFIVLRREGEAWTNWSRSFNNIMVHEVRAYQTQNVLLELQGTATIVAPDPTAPQWSAQNLITNMSTRSSGNDLPPLIDGAATTATFQSCYKTDDTKLSALGHKMVLTVDLKQSFFQHAVLFVGDLGANWFTSSGPIYFENVRVYVGDSPNYLLNAECAGGPFLVNGDPKSYVFGSWAHSGFSGSVWRYGQEVWCNLLGRYTTLVSDMTHKAGSAYTISLCQLGVMAAIYERSTPAPTTFTVTIGSPQTLSIAKITAKASFPIGNTLNIQMRQKTGAVLSWVTFTDGTLVTQVNIAPDSSVSPGTYTLVLESFDQAGGVFSTLKTDTIYVTVNPGPPECLVGLSQSVAFETTQPIVLIQEYQPTVFFPQVLFAGPHTFTGYACGGTYTQSITLDSPVTGVVINDRPAGPDLRPSLAIGVSALAGSTFTLTFNGRYLHAPSSTDITSSFTQTYTLKSVFSTAYLDQPIITHSLTGAQLTFTIPPAVAGATPPTHTLASKLFTVAYPIKTGILDPLGNTPPAIVPVPYVGFSSTEIAKGQSSLGTTSLTSPQGSLTAVGFSGDLSPGGTLAFACDPWSIVIQGTTAQKTLTFANSVVPAFTASVSIACTYESAFTPCTVRPPEWESLSESLRADPLRLEVFAGQLDFKAISYKSKFDLVNELKKARSCINISIKLVSKHTFLKLEPDGFRLTLHSDANTVEGTFEDSYLEVTLDALSLQIPITAQFKTCTVASVAFEKDQVSVTYTLGSAALRHVLPKVVQTPNCGQFKQQIVIKTIVSSLTNQKVTSAVTLDLDENALVIQSQDVSMAGKWATLIISVDGGATQTVKQLFVAILFESEATLATATGDTASDLVEPSYAADLGVKFGIPNFVVPLLTKDQADIVKETSSPNLSEEQLFKSVPLAARLTQGVEGVKRLADEQLAHVSNKPETATLDSSLPEARFERLTSSGLLLIKFTHSLLFPNGTLEEIQTEIAEHKNMTQAELGQSRARVQLYVVRDYEPDEGQDEGFILQSWELVALDKDSMQIQCVFFAPLDVSQHEEPDLLMIQLELSQYKDIRGKALPESLVKYWPIPLQVASTDDALFIGQFGWTTASISIGLLTGSGLLLILLQAVVSYLWSIINGLQIVHKQNLLDVRVPANVSTFMNFFTAMSGLSVEIPGLKVEDLYYLPEQLALNLNFQMAGYTSSYVLVNLQQPMLVLCGYLAFVVLWLALALMSRCCPRCYACRDRLTRLLFWNGLLRIVIEGCADFTLFALLNLSCLEWSDLHTGVNVSNYTMIGLINLCVVVPLAFFMYSLCRRERWATTSFNDRAGTFLAGTNRERKDGRWAVLSVPLFFFCRRWALSASLVYLNSFFIGQIVTQLVSSLLMLFVVNWARPLESPHATRKETFNEVVSLMVSYLLMNYTNFQPDAESRYRLGFLHIGLFCIYLLVHLGLIVWVVGRRLILNFRRCKSRGWCFCCKRKRPLPIKKQVKKEKVQSEKQLSAIQEESEASHSAQSQESSVAQAAQRRVVPQDSEFEQSHEMISSSAKILLEQSLLDSKHVRRPRITVAGEQDSGFAIVEDYLGDQEPDESTTVKENLLRQPWQDSSHVFNGKEAYPTSAVALSVAKTSQTYEEDGQVVNLYSAAVRALLQESTSTNELHQRKINAGARDFDLEWSLYERETQSHNERF